MNMNDTRPTTPLKKYKGVVPSPVSTGRPIKQAYLEKLNHFGTAWQKRFFELRPRTLSYYRSDKMDVMDAQIDLRYVTLVQQCDRNVDLYLADDKLGDKSKRYRLRATTPDHAAAWCHEIRQAQIHASKTDPSPTASSQHFFEDATQNKPAAHAGAAKQKGLPLALLQLWVCLVMICAILSVGALLPMPFLTMWFLKVGVLCGVLHANVLKVYGCLLVCSVFGMVMSSSAHRRLFRTCVLAVSAAIAVLLLPTLLAMQTASALPGQLSTFLSDSGLTAVTPQFVFDQSLQPTKQNIPFSLWEFLRDLPCSLANGSEFRHLAHTVTYKTFDASDHERLVQDKDSADSLIDWSGLGGIYEGHEPDHLQLTVFRPPQHAHANRSLPVLVSLHGGGWYSGSMYDGLQCYLQQALGLGFAVITAEYRLGERGWRGKHMVEDVSDLVEWIRVNGTALGLDYDRVVLMGGSSGAHLALTAGYSINARAQRRVIKGVAARYGATDLTAAWHAPKRLYSGWVGLGWNERIAIEHITGGRPSPEFEEEYTRLSPVSHVGQHTPPTILLHCRQDEFYGVGVHADALRQTLQDAQVPSLLIDPSLHSHGCDIGSTAPFQLARFALSHFLSAVAAQPASVESPPVAVAAAPPKAVKAPKPGVSRPKAAAAKARRVPADEPTQLAEVAKVAVEVAPGAVADAVADSTATAAVATAADNANTA